MPRSSGRVRPSTRARREEILDAALETFLEVGESGTFIHQVCHRAGVSVGTLYHHFGSKDQLMATLHYSLLQEYQNGAGRILEADPSAEDGIRQTVAYHLRWLVSHPRQATFLLQQPFAGYRSDRVPPDLVEANERFLRTVQGWLRREMAQGRIRTLPFDTVVALLIGPVHHWARGQLFLGYRRAAARAGDAAGALADGAWQALRPDR